MTGSPIDSCDRPERMRRLATTINTCVTALSCEKERSSNLAQQLQGACEELLHQITNPRDYLLNLAQGHRIEAALQCITRFQLATIIPPHGAISLGEIALRANLPPQKCGRILRLLITAHIFDEPTPGAFAHNRTSLFLRDEQIHGMVAYYTGESLRVASFLADALDHWPDSQQRNETALNLAYNTPLPKFDFFATEPERAARFSRAMMGMASHDRFGLHHLIGAFDWAGLPPGATVVDVGASSGHCSHALATAFEHLNFVVQDLEGTVGNSQASRLKFMAHDFFRPQPVIADIYLLRWILHDYPDAEASAILRAQASVLRDGARIMIMDGVMMPPGVQPRSVERAYRQVDMAMMMMLNSRERDLSEWRTLFHQVDPRLRLVSTCKPLESSLSVTVLELTGSERP
ncbi:hypothetical protein FE257_004285 [Aspergillus nanangensis]|uniref:O-methyltransferase domain-containing protein n=1 Tax=Aspergillus nanangensis TaxID=2582783 RepID=A0AAD4CRL7_ASPNN|nr:hypothetical protein FE257_004285 [Aspergillus nanangensis]